MLINELPDECLLTIFHHISDLTDLINCYKVCFRWSQLVIERSKKAEYLVVNRADGFDDDSVTSYPDDSSDLVYFDLNKRIDVTVLKILFGNLKIVDALGLRSSVQLEDIVSLVKNQKSLKGLIDNYNMRWESSNEIVNVNNKLKMLSIDFMNDELEHHFGSSLKQLQVRSCDLEPYIIYYTESFPNLERLNVIYKGGKESGYFCELPTKNIKILEISVDYSDLKENCALQFIDLCPNLQSAYVVVDCEDLFVFNKTKHRFLQDLVLDFSITEKMNMDGVMEQLMKYPNLKHLSLTDKWSIKDEHIERMVNIFPDLVLFNASGCVQVTERSADFVQDYCKRFGRSIKFYFKGNKHEIKVDWPHLSTKRETIGRGFDFMKNCFLKSFDDLPTFLIPDDF